jgi:hypothetical protein
MSLRLSEQHGVNPSVEQCFTCMKDVGVVLFGKINAGRHARPADRDPQAPLRVCFGPNSEPCAECKKHMGMGIILISVDEPKSTDMKNPWRTGGWAVVSEAFIKRVLNPPELVEAVLKRRMAFMPDEVWDMLGLPRGEENQVQEEAKGD